MTVWLIYITLMYEIIYMHSLSNGEKWPSSFEERNTKLHQRNLSYRKARYDIRMHVHCFSAWEFVWDNMLAS